MVWFGFVDAFPDGINFQKNILVIIPFSFKISKLAVPHFFSMNVEFHHFNPVPIDSKTYLRPDGMFLEPPGLYYGRGFETTGTFLFYLAEIK